MRILKKLLLIIGVTAGLTTLLYYGFLKNKYTDVLHTEIDRSEFSPDLEGIEKMIDWYFENYQVPAITAAIVYEGKVIKTVFRGTQSRNNPTPVDGNSIFQIASLSKTLTGIICKALEKEGTIDLNKTIPETLGDELNEIGKKRFQNVTLKNVLFHNSGLGRSMFAYSKEDIIRSLNNDELVFSTGEKWEYSNYGYALVALILEKETGKTYRELLKEYVVLPYGLSDIDTELNSNQKSRLVQPYYKHFRLFEGEIYDFGMQTAASGIFASTENLASLMIQQLKDYAHFDSLRKASHLILNDEKIATWDDENFYGFGIFEHNFEIRYDTTITHNYLAHGGDADGNVCNYGFFPDYNLGVVLMSSWGGPWFGDMYKNINAKILEWHMVNRKNL